MRWIRTLESCERTAGRSGLTDSHTRYLPSCWSARATSSHARELKRRLWPADTFVDFERGINTAVTRLRQSLGDSAETPRFIETLPRRGYRFVYPTEIPSHQTTGMAARWNKGAGLAILTVVSFLARFWD